MLFNMFMLLNGQKKSSLLSDLPTRHPGSVSSGLLTTFPPLGLNLYSTPHLNVFYLILPLQTEDEQRGGGEKGSENASGHDLVLLPRECRPDGEFRKPEISAPGKVFVSHCINQQLCQLLAYTLCSFCAKGLIEILFIQAKKKMPEVIPTIKCISPWMQSKFTECAESSSVTFVFLI